MFNGAFSASLSWDTVFDATVRSVCLALSVALFSGVVGALCAWLVTRTNLPKRNLFAQILSVPYALPAYLLAMAWVVLGNPKVGLLRDFIPFEQGSYGFFGMFFVESCVAFVFAYLETKAGFERLDPSLEEAAQMSGASTFKTLKDVSLPLLWPSILNGMSLAFLYTLSSFGVPAILGLPVRKFVLTTLIYSQLKMGGESGLRVAFQLSLILLLITFLVLVFSYYLKKKQRAFSAIMSGKSSRASVIDLGRFKGASFLLLLSFWSLIVLLPWIALGLSALAPIAGDFHPSHFTLRNLSYVLNLPDFYEGLVNSIAFVFFVSTLIVVVGFFLGYLIVRKKSKFFKIISQTLSIPFALPGSIIAIVIIVFSTLLGKAFYDLGIYLSLTVFWMGAAYFLKYFSLGGASIEVAFNQIDVSLEEAAQVSGAGVGLRLKTIWFPLLKNHLLGSWILISLPVFTELTMSVLLTGPGAANLGTVLFQLQEYADQPSAAALAWMLLTFAMAISLISARLRKERS